MGDSRDLCSARCMLAARLLRRPKADASTVRTLLPAHMQSFARRAPRNVPALLNNEHRRFTAAAVVLTGAAATIPVTVMARGLATASNPQTKGGIPPLTLYQYSVCPFCNKLRAFLDYHQLPYSIIEVNPMSKKELEFSEYKKVPVVLMGGEQLNDSGEIIQRLGQAM